MAMSPDGKEAAMVLILIARVKRWGRMNWQKP
jgi:hypothetical protein